MPAPSSSLVDTLLERCILLLDGGDQAGVDTLLAEHPDLAPTLRERIEQLASFGILKAPREPAPIPERLGDFRLLRQIGRGGMGVVYLAEQTSLQREVALKLVHPEQLFFSGARERFRREVLAIARLQHPGIVPILTGGEAEGIPFYAMDMVPGASLAEVLAQLAGTAAPALDGRSLRAALQRAMTEKKDLTAVDDAPAFHGSWANACARLVLDAAEALAHAHAHGVLHRDVKPSNMLLTAAGHVRVIDFGLASAEGEQRITRSGATLGSLPYMAPEQVRGDTARVDARTDVYALGVTLYELLTLTLPHGDGGGRTRERILAGHVEPPARRNPLIHADVDAICLMAMDPDPGRRYQTVADFALDLRAFLDQRTVRARRPGALLRARRWMRRNPVQAAVAAVLLIVLVPGPLLFAWQQNQAAARIRLALDDAEHQRRAAEANLRTAETEQQRAEFNLDQAIEAVDQMLLRTAEARLADIPRTAKLRRRLLQDAVDFHQRLLAGAGAGSGNRVRAERARAQMRLGTLQCQLGDLTQGIPLLRESVATFEELFAASPDSTSLRLNLARAHDALADTMRRTGDIDAEGTSRRRTMELFEDLASRTSGELELSSGAEARLDLAVNVGRHGRFDEARSLLDALEHRLDDPADPLGKLPDAKRQLLRTYLLNNRALLFTSRGDTQAAMAAFQAALAEADRPLTAGTPQPGLDGARLSILERLGLLAHQRRQWELAAPWLDRICDEYERRVADEPEVVSWQESLARLLSTRATNRRMLDNVAGATADHDRCVALLTELVRKGPAEVAFRSSLALALAERAAHRSFLGDAKGTLADFERCDQVFEQAIELAPHDDQIKANRVAAMANHAGALARMGDYGAARDLNEHAIELAQQLPGPVARGNLIDMLMLGSDYAMRDGDTDDALRRADRAAAMAKEFLQERPEDVPRLFTAASTALNYGTIYLSYGRNAEAIRIWEEALPVCRAGAAAAPYGRKMLVMVLLRLADVHMRDNEVEQARRWFQLALEETKATAAMVEECPPLPDLFEAPELHDLLPDGHPDK